MKNNTIIVILAVLLSGAFIAAGILAFKLNTTRTELDSSRQRIDQCRSTVTDLNTQVARLPIEERKARQCARELETVKQTLTRQLTAARESRQISEKQVLALQQDLQEMQTRLADARDKASQAGNRVASCEQQIADLEAQNSDLAMQKAAAETQASELNNRIADLAQAEADLQTANETIAQLKLDVTACNAQLAEANTALEQKNAQVETLNQDLAEANEIITGYEDRLETIFGTKSRIEKEFQRFKQTHTSLVTDLEQQIKDREITVDRLQEQITITFIDKILFSSGRVSLNPKGKNALDKVGRILLKETQGREIMVVGHTDNLHIHPDYHYKFPTNWELSAHRAASVVRYLQHKTGLDPGNMSAVGRSFYDPVAGNDTPEGRAQNRRVEIIIAPNIIQPKPFLPPVSSGPDGYPDRL